MLITKKESKQLRYFARANYKADVKGTTAEDGSKVKHRDFPVFGLSYDEKKADKGMVEITNIQVLYKPFEGTTFAELMEALNDVLGSDDVGEKVEAVEQHYEPCLLHGPDCTQEPLPPGPPIVQPIAESQEEPEHLFGPMSHRGVVGDALNFFKDVKLVNREPQAAENPPKESASVADIPEEVKENVLEVAETVTTLVHPEMQVVSKEIKDLSEDGTLTVDVKAVANNPVDSVDVHIDVNKLKENNAQEDTVDASESAKFVEEHEAPVLEVKNVPDQEIPVIEDVTEAKRVTEETGTPVVTAEQKPKKLSRAELYDLQMKCGVMRLATLYGESPDTGLDVLMKLYPDAASRLNEVYAADGIKTYTITEEAIKKAYPDEYAALRK